MSKYNALILGANGQLGQDLCKEFACHGISYTPWTKSEFDPLVDDLEQKLTTLLSQTPSIIINCIATTNVDGCEDNSDLAFAINSAFVYKLAKICHLRQITLIHFSTDYVFDGTKVTPYTEEDLPNPLNIYGLSKYAGELAIQNYHDKYFIFRTSSLFGKAGASGKGGNFITAMQNLGRSRESVSVIADQFTCPTATLDVARCVCYFIINAIHEYGIYNCVSSNWCSWFDFAQQIFVLSGIDENKLKPADFASYNFKAMRPQYEFLAATKLGKYYQMPTWESSLAEYFTPE